MSKRMLIDATHREETRVAITDGNKLAEYDYESQTRKPIKGSIFLAKVTRVEPSLQAAFVNFGGNRHGFLPFSEIHPDYFRIPVSDREALMAEQEALLQEHDEEEEFEDEGAESDSDLDQVEEPAEPVEVGGVVGALDGGEEAADDLQGPEVSEHHEYEHEHGLEDDREDSDGDGDADENSSEGNNDRAGRHKGRGRGRGRGRGGRSQYRNQSVEVVGGDDLDTEQRFRFNLRRKYKIQEVIKRGQIMLVQANKEERGNKGAAVGTYLSLPGRYCVLMPNSPRAGGVSRKIANGKDRARMREIVKDLELPKGMSVIVRTAGVERSKAEIKRDLDYLMRLWNNIRELTLQSSAPAIVYEEADLIKRSVRDLYTKDIEEIFVAGEEGYKTARDFMKMLIPSHVKKVKKYEESLPLFHRYQIESQIDEIGQMEVRLRAGGYLVINPTEALVSIDVNSGKSTKGRHIEETALKTNLEAADEVARQLKLRDLGGLVVIDFIDMEDRRNNAKVERRMRDALSADRARVQVGRISSFGLMELSRQRLSPSLTESQFEKCKACAGTGVVRTSDAMSILVLRAIEEEGIRGRAAQIIVQVTNDVALYILNHKRKKLEEIEARYNFEVLLRVDDTIPVSDYRVEVSRPVNAADGDDVVEIEDVAAEEPRERAERPAAQSSRQDSRGERERSSSDEERPRRRGRRGGRNRNRNRSEQPNAQGQAQREQQPDDRLAQEAEKTVEVVMEPKEQMVDINQPQEKPLDKVADKPKRARKPRKSESVAANDDAAKSENSKVQVKPEVKEKAEEKKESASVPAPVREYEVVNEAPEQKKKGWWNRLVD